MPVRVTIIKKSTDNKFGRGFGEKGTLLYCWWEYKLVHLLWKTVWMFLKNLKIELVTTYISSIPLLGKYPKKTIIQKDTAPQCSSQHCLKYKSQDMGAT